MHPVIQRIGEIGLVPVIAIEDAKNAVPLARALCTGGLPVAEVTFRTNAAAEAIGRIVAEVPGMLVGAGTVLTTENVEHAAAAGAEFIVAPGLNPKIIKHAEDLGLPIIPGVSTGSEIEQAMELGLEVVKFFPAEQSGGLATLKALSAPYGKVRFMPTGGINAKNLGDYIAFSKIIACGGSWMVGSDLINAGKFDEITELARQAVDAMLGFEFFQIGIGCGSSGEASARTDRFAEVFSNGQPEGKLNILSNLVKFTETTEKAESGHIVIGTTSLYRAVAHLRERGIQFEDPGAPIDGNLRSIRLAEEFSGFCVQLVQK